MTYRIKDWGEIFENNRSRELKRMEWVPIPNRMDGGGYVELIEHPNGAAHFGAWLAIVEIASRQKIRGTLPQLPAGIPHSDAEIARLLSKISRIPAVIFEELIPRLLDLHIGWIEGIPQEGEVIPQEGAVIPQATAVIPQDDAALRECAGARLITGNGMEWKEVSVATGSVFIEKKQEEHTPETPGVNGKPNGVCSTPRFAYLNDQEFAPFVVAACKIWPDLIEEDLQASWQFTWRKFNFQEKHKAVLGLHAHIEAGSDGRYVSRPPKYLESGDWKRPPRKAVTKESREDRHHRELMED